MANRETELMASTIPSDSGELHKLSCSFLSSFFLLMIGSFYFLLIWRKIKTSIGIVDSC